MMLLAFALDTGAVIPQTIQRAQRGRVLINGRGLRVGVAIGVLELRTPALPGIMLVPVKLRVDVPAYATTVDTIDLDTICPGVDIASALQVTNATACAVTIDSIEILGPDSLTCSPVNGFTISARGRVSLGLSAFPRVDGPFLSTIRIRSTVAGDRTVVVRGIAATRSMSAPPTISFGDVRVGTSLTNRVSILNSGTGPVTVRAVAITGAQSVEYTFVVVGGPLPLTLAPGASLDLDVTSTPTDIESRRATLSVTTEQPLCVTLQPIALSTRGIQPLLDVVTREVIGGRRCVGAPYDTMIVMRNVGNAPLNVTNVQWSAPWATSIGVTLPFTLDSGATMSMPVRVDAPLVGPNQATCTITMDGDWLTPSDTLIQLSTAGLVCGTMYVDTIYADVGTRPNVNVRLQPDGRTTQTEAALLDLINAYGGRRTLTLRADRTLLLFGNTVTGALSGATAAPSSGAVLIDQQGAMVQSPVLAAVPVDVMLSSTSRSIIDLSVTDLVDGYHDLRVESGLLLASYCAKDERLVHVGTAPLVWAEQENIVVYARESSMCHVSIYTLDGRSIFQHSSSVNSGETVRIAVPHESSGTYYAVVTTPRGTTTLRFVTP
ncbi:MAG: choice-of-anchor D domain-containing protein [Ignavibacteria bacterium]|nr:choice-of-anchor D domain-containing protein [Ignavibacteria bacterium]